MAHARWNDETDDDDVEGSDDDESYADDTSELIPCPECGAEIHEESQQCPLCGHYITPANRLWLGRPWWWIVLGALGLAGAVCTMLLNY